MSASNSQPVINPDRAEQIRAKLKGRWPSTRQDRFAATYNSQFVAVRSLAWAVAAGLIQAHAVEATIVGSRKIAAAPPNGGTLKHALLDEFHEAITTAEIARDKAQRAVSKAIGHLIDAAAHQEEVRTAAQAANADAWLFPSEVDGIIAREQAWWVRLHAQLAQAQLTQDRPATAQPDQATHA